MKSKRLLQFIAIIEALLICLLVCNALNEQKYARELFINKIYFLFDDAADNLIAGRYDDAAFNLAKVDTLCVVCNQDTAGRFQYSKPNFFEDLSYGIRNNNYSQDELLIIASKIQTLVCELSSDTGISENSMLSYKDLNDIFNSFYRDFE